MHLGQTASFLAKVMNRPDPSMKMLSRLLRDSDRVRKGPRGRNAPHLNSEELAEFLIAFMASPDSPATGLDRLPHFRDLPLDAEDAKGRTFGQALAMVLGRLADESAKEAMRKAWRVTISIQHSAAVIEERLQDNETGGLVEVDHQFSSSIHADPNEPAIAAMPYYGGLDITVTLRWFTLFRIAKAVLGNEPDPLDALAEMVAGTLTEEDE